MTLKRNHIVYEIIVVLLVIIFMYAGISKITNYKLFKDQIAESTMLAGLIPFIAPTLLFVEFSVVLLLVIPRWRLLGLYASLGLMTVFTGYIVTLLFSSQGFPCACGGLIELLSPKQHIVFNSAFILLSVFGIIHERQKKRENKEVFDSINNC